MAFSIDGSTRAALAEEGLMVWAIGKVYEIRMVSACQRGNVGKHLGPSDETIDWELGFSF